MKESRLLCFALYCLATILLLPACVAKQASKPEVIEPLTYFNSEVFDNRLSEALSGDPAEVEVLFPAPITLNTLPERLDRWLSKVDGYKGKVELVPVGPADKGLFSDALSFVATAYQYMKEKALYFPVRDYDAKIFYTRASGDVENVVFVRKPDADKK